MSFVWFASAENDDNASMVGVISPLQSGGIVTSPALTGSQTFSGLPNDSSRYGWGGGLDEQDHLLISFQFRWTSTFDEAVIISEIGSRSGGGAFVRALSLDTNRRIRLFDAGGSTVGQTGTGYLSVDTTYRILIHYDFRNTVNTIDQVWVHNGTSWDLAINVADHGNVNVLVIDAGCFGTQVGKTKTTTSGILYFDAMAFQDLATSPNTTPLGSIKTVLKVPTSNGTDGDFNTGTGTNPDWNDVKEVNSDDATSTDVGDVAGDQQSYNVADAVVNDVPLAVQIFGVAQRAGGGTVNVKTYVYDGTTRDYNESFNFSTGWRGVYDFWDGRAYNKINGATLTEALFNSLEVGIEINSVSGGGALELSQIGLEYIVEGPVALPDDFPVGALGDIRKTVFY